MSPAFFRATAMMLATMVAASFAVSASGASDYSPPAEQASSKDGSTASAKKAARIANHKLEKAVRVALVKGGTVDLSHISVIARGGAVTLAGYVSESAQVQVAEQRASEVNGVTSVRNLVTVGAAGH